MPDSITHNLDSHEAIKTIADNAFALALVDCPYGIGEDGSKNHSRSCIGVSKDYKAYSGNDLDAPPVEFFIELFRISRNQIIWGANHFIERINEARKFLKLKTDSPCWIVWDKQNGLNDFADCELAWTSFSTAVRKFDFRWQGMLQGNMKNKEIRIHPNQKPVTLYRFLLTNYAKSGDRIIDTHLGSQSSRIAAEELGLDFVGYEKDKFYFDEGNARFDKHLAQPKLFEPPKQELVQEGLF